MEIQNLRVYERHGLVSPDRTPGGTRLYSAEDVTRLIRIGELLDEGLNLAGIARVLNLEASVDRLRRRTLSYNVATRRHATGRRSMSLAHRGEPKGHVSF